MTAWQWLVLVLCALAIGLTLNEVFVPAGDTGASPNGTNLVLAVAPGGAAHTAGLRTGDRLDYSALTPIQRFQVFGGINAVGERVLYPIVDATGTARTIVVVARRVDRSSIGWAFAIAGHFWFIAFALLIAWRRPRDARARVMTMLLLAQVTGAGFSNLGTLWPAVNLVNLLLNATFYPLSVALLATYASLFADPPGRLRAAFTRLAYFLAGAVPLVFMGWLFWADAPTYSAIFRFPFSAASVVVSVLCVLLGLVAAHGDERQRLAWAALPLCALFVLGIQAAAATSAVLWGLLEFGTPLLLTYALLSRRVLDLGFVLNRAAVFSGVSIVLLGVFVLAEWLLGDWLKGASHTTNIVVAAILALGLGLSIRFVHTRVEQVLDALLFRKRHEDERAILNFAQQAPFVTDSELLISRTVEVLERHADASFVTLALSNGCGWFGDVDENDRAILALRARNRTLDLHTVETKLRGEFAYPMVARGRLVGALVVGPKRSQESYDPDEMTAIAEVARSVAGALDALYTNGGTARDALLDRLELLAERMEIISTRLAGHPNST